MNSILQKIKIANISFLLGLLFVIQGNMPLKILGLVFLIAHRPSIIKNHRGFASFYVLILLYHAITGTITLFEEGYLYLVPFLMVAFFWAISYLTTNYLNAFVFDLSSDKVKNTVDVLFLLCVAVIAFQYLHTAWQLGALNPYGATQAAGDRMKSVFSNSSESMLIMSFFFLRYIMRGNIVYSAIALLSAFLAAYMSGTALFFAGVSLGLLFFSNFKLKFKLYFVGLTVLILAIFIFTSPGNYNYASGYIQRIIAFKVEDLPYKIISFIQTLQYWTESIWHFIFGAGGGNFSSRVAFIASGDYVSWYPESLVHISREFNEYHFGIWTYDFKNPWDNRDNTANQPFSFYNKILGEYGLIGLSLYSIIYLRLIFQNWRILTYSKFLLIVLLGYFILDYWYEYFSVIVIFELLVLMDIKEGTANNKTLKHANTG